MTTIDKLAPGLTRDQLVEHKNAIDARLNTAKIELDDARAKGAARRQYMPIEEFTRLRLTIVELQRDSQALQAMIGKASKTPRAAEQDKGRAYLQEFYLAARTQLSREQFAAIAKQAEANAREHA